MRIQVSKTQQHWQRHVEFLTVTVMSIVFLFVTVLTASVFSDKMPSCLD